MASSLSERAVRDVYCQTCKTIFETSGNASDSGLQRELIRAVNVALTSSGVPEVALHEDLASDANGYFDFTAWNITFGGAQSGAARTSGRFTGLANTVYHEARHCEQWYRILQALAAGHIALGIGDVMSGKFSAFSADSADSMHSTLGVPTEVAAAAISNSDYSPVRRRSIEEWWRSIYSQGGTLRNNVLHKIDDRYTSYQHLPEEEDAWREGDAAERDIKALIGDRRTRWPNARDWKALTGRTWHFRSGRFLGGADTLVHLDHAIEDYEEHGESQADALVNAFNAWKAANPKESLTRNRKKDGDGQGAIDKMQHFVDQRGQRIRMY